MAVSARPLIPRIPLAMWRVFLEPQAATPDRGPAPEGFPGVWVHGWLFRRLADVDPAFSSAMHGAAQKQFSLSPPLHTPVDVSAPGSWYVEITAWGGVAPAMVEAALQRLPSHLILGPVGWHIVACERHLTLGPYLEQAAAELPMEPVTAVETPLSFRRAGQQWPFPVPDLWLSNLAARLAWREYSPPPAIRVSWFQGKTQALHLNGYDIHGFVGRMGWDLSNLDATTSLRVRWLLLVGQYIGVGYKTSMGLGRTRILNDRQYVRPGQSDPQ